MAENNKTRVALVFGGQSPEHGVSCLTASRVLAAIDHDRFDVLGVGITKQGQWRRVDLADMAAYQITDGQVPQVAPSGPEAVWLQAETGCQVATREGSQLADINDVDVVFVLLHGPFGEDGTIQGQFEMMGVRYVGSGVAASAMAMDKQYMRIAFEAAGLAVAPYEVIAPEQWRHNAAEALARVQQLQFPLFVKPCRGGSSIGITRVDDPAELAAAIEEAQRYDPKVIVEQGLLGCRELECAVLADPDLPEGCRASDVGEIKVLDGSGFYDFEVKYLHPEQAALDLPAELTEAERTAIQQAARQAFRSLGCESLARVDVFLDAAGKVWLNEINTMPGFTEISMFPSLWQHQGLAYADLITRLIELALQRPLGLR